MTKAKIEEQLRKILDHMDSAMEGHYPWESQQAYDEFDDTPIFTPQEVKFWADCIADVWRAI